MRPARLIAAAALITLASTSTAFAAPNPIQLENAKPGTTAWDTENGSPVGFPVALGGIDGYASEISVQPGDVLHLHVSTTPAAPYRVEIYRLGWYQGTGGRLIACLPSCSGSEPGAIQATAAADPKTGELDAGWPVTDTITVAPDWTSGYFVAKLNLTGGPHAGHAQWIPFIVRSASAVKSAILVQASVNTWEAYNNWGGKSLYTFNSSGPTVPASGTVAAAMVSFNRPFASNINTGPFSWEYQLVRFLEREGYDVSYQTDVDTDLGPASLLGHRLDVVSGHDEYWSSTMRAAWQAARDGGANLAFLGGNIGYWQSRYANGDRTLVEYRSAKLDPDPDPAQKTEPFSQLTPALPECQLLGIGYQGGGFNPSDPPRSYQVTSAAAATPWLRGTGLSPGDTIFDSVGYEWDSVQPGCATPPLTVLLHFAGLRGVAGSPAPADAVMYTAQSGARVFSDGSKQLVWALDDFAHAPHVDARVQALLTNLLDGLGGPPGPAGPGAVALGAPAPRAVLWSPQPRLTWAPAIGSGSPVAFYRVIVDGKRVATTGGTSIILRHALSDGRHSWAIVAVDGAGGQRMSPARTFTVASVRLARDARPIVLAHGFTVRVWCPHRCSILVRIQLGRGGPVSSVTARVRHGGVSTVVVRLAPRFAARLRGARRPAPVTVTVRTPRRVRLTARI